MPNDLAGDTSTSTLDVEAMSDRIGASLGEDLVGKMQTPTETPGLQEAVSNEPSEPQSNATTTPIETPRYDVPKSWKREMHDHWGKISPDAQAYIIEREKQLLEGFSRFKPVQEALTPHMEYLNQKGIQAPYAIDSLIRAHRMLTEGPIEQRRQHLRQLEKNLGLVDENPSVPSTPQQPVDPIIQSVQQKISSIEQQLQQERAAQIARIRQEHESQVEAFAADTKAHPYFDEVAEQIAILVSQGQSLQDAYDNAVWLNPATRAKEQARLLTEHEAKLKENARLAALPKKKAASVNISSNGSGSEPTEPAGSLEDTIKSTLRDLRKRA